MTQEQLSQPQGYAIWNLGFRPFFFGASWFAAFNMLLWLWIYRTGVQVYPAAFGQTLWHAHELLFGYATAVIAGFLLTASKNWTGRQTLHRTPLACLFVLWLAARIMLITPGVPPWIPALLDISFNAWLLIAVSVPIIATRQSRQYAILGKLIFVLACNTLFYADLLGLTEGFARPAMFTMLYVVVGLILMMCRRLIPFFVERGVGYPVTLKNSRVADLASLFLFLGFFVAEVFFTGSSWVAIFAGLLVPVLAIRAWWWYTPGVFSKPLLWSLFIAYLAIVLGFLLYALVPFGVMPSLAMHALTVGGIGLITVAMMARVSWGHSGRNIQSPPKVLGWIFAGLAVSLLARVLGPMFLPQAYLVWILLAGALWSASCLVFAASYTPVWLGPRTDGRYG